MTEIERIIQEHEDAFPYDPERNTWVDYRKFLAKAIEQYVIKARIEQLHKLDLGVPECFQVQEMIVGLNKELDALAELKKGV